jgi:ATP-dependent helicase HrpA
VVVVCGETGSGKTTQLPKICLEIGRGLHGLIGHTQPRRIAARATATRISAGAQVGTRPPCRLQDPLHRQGHAVLLHQADDRRHPAGRDPDRSVLRQYDTILIDEAHERSLNIDFLLGYLKQCCRSGAT